MGSNYPDALADFMETAARPLENAHEVSPSMICCHEKYSYARRASTSFQTAPGTRIYNREYFVTPRAQTHPGDVSFVRVTRVLRCPWLNGIVDNRIWPSGPQRDAT